jgi:thymidylate synthase (FAD)
MPEARKIFNEAFEEAEYVYADLLAIAAEKEGVASFDDIKDFNTKKIYTSAARRVAPMGLATNIGWTCNIRELRHVLELRTSPAAEEEMRLVFGAVGHIVTTRYPNFFQDFTPTQDGNFTIWSKKQ